MYVGGLFCFASGLETDSLTKKVPFIIFSSLEEVSSSMSKDCWHDVGVVGCEGEIRYNFFLDKGVASFLRDAVHIYS